MKGSTPTARGHELLALLRAQYDDGTDADECNIIDMLTDLRHACDTIRLDFATCDLMAYEHYCEEVQSAALQLHFLD